MVMVNAQLVTAFARMSFANSTAAILRGEHSIIVSQ
jgi:hypothetical protein